MTIIFSTCWYLFKAKFDPSVFSVWIDNMLSNVNNYYLVIYTDKHSISFVENYGLNPRIKIVEKPIEEFYNYKYREQWISNHERNDFIKNKVDWRVNMLWSEKIHFVEQTINEKYHNKDNNITLYGWCDIGYFRGREYDLSTDKLSMWPNNIKLNSFNMNKIHYACVNNDTNYINEIFRMVNNKNEKGLPKQELSANQISIGGGFFMLDKSKMEWWKNLYDTTLNLYFENGYLIKDDQIILADCIFSNMPNFILHTENIAHYDNWFMFQRILS